jgi:hypothetical protein
MNLIPNIPPKAFSFSAVIVGYLLIDDMTANEQNALGNWLMLVAQVISTNAFYKQVMSERGMDNSDEIKKNNNINNQNNPNIDEIIMLEKMIKALKQEIENLKNNTN